MSAARVVRVGVGAVGAAAVAYGLWLLVGLGPGQLEAVLVWAVGGIVAHDGIIAPVVVVLGIAVAVRAPGWLRTPLLWSLVVLGPLTLLAVPVLGSFGAKADNPSLLDRPYWLGYAVVVALVLGVVAVVTLVTARRLAAPAAREHDDVRPG